MTLRNLIVGLLVLLILSVNGAAWTSVYLLNRAQEARDDQAESAEARTEQVRQDVDDLHEEIRRHRTITEERR